jgi:hypothetical protein
MFWALSATLGQRRAAIATNRIVVRNFLGGTTQHLHLPRAASERLTSPPTVWLDLGKRSSAQW